MQKTILSGLAIALLLGTSAASATSDNKYPASDFKPKVIFIDKDAVAAAPKAPADSKPVSTVAAGKTPFDPKFPAASFEPKVVFP
ncbi:MAG: hypothetical protein CTY29_01620 [Methylobacter sp.]|nr:MAG: hypothetical protein CTY29_01620 [Methylobacter sp.]PPD36834.1 MAG: hypothetical protein CTY18_03355 [Methylomonas sp.]